MGNNPFIGGSYRQRQGQQTPPNRPDRVKPVPEHYQGQNFPYRGTETHGVKPPADMDADAYYHVGMWDDGEAETIKSEPELKTEDVIPVRIVQGEKGRQRLDWRAGRFYVQNIAQELVGRLETRRSLRIKNNSQTATIYIGPDSGVAVYTGYPLGPGQDILIYSTENVFAVTDNGSTAEVGILTEYAVEL